MYNKYQIDSYDIYYIKTNYKIGAPLNEYADEFCESCKIQSVVLYKINQDYRPILHISYILDNDTTKIYNLSVDLKTHDISYIFRRKWAHDIYQVHRELFRKFALPNIRDLHEDLMASYWHIDNMPIWFHELSQQWDQGCVKL